MTSEIQAEVGYEDSNFFAVCGDGVYLIFTLLSSIAEKEDNNNDDDDDGDDTAGYLAILNFGEVLFLNGKVTVPSIDEKTREEDRLAGEGMLL